MCIYKTNSYSKRMGYILLFNEPVTFSRGQEKDCTCICI